MAYKREHYPPSSYFQLIKDEECHEGTDAEFDTLILDEDKFCDVLEPMMEEGGVVCLYCTLLFMRS